MEKECYSSAVFRNLINLTFRMKPLAVSVTMDNINPVFLENIAAQNLDHLISPCLKVMKHRNGRFYISLTLKVAIMKIGI